MFITSQCSSAVDSPRGAAILPKYSKLERPWYSSRQLEPQQGLFSPGRRSVHGNCSLPANYNSTATLACTRASESSSSVRTSAIESASRIAENSGEVQSAAASSRSACRAHAGIAAKSGETEHGSPREASIHMRASPGSASFAGESGETWIMGIRTLRACTQSRSSHSDAIRSSSPADVSRRSQIVSNAGIMYSESSTFSSVALAYLQHSTIDIALKSCSRCTCTRSASEGALSSGDGRGSDSCGCCSGFAIAAAADVWDTRARLAESLAERLEAFAADAFVAMVSSDMWTGARSVRRQATWTDTLAGLGERASLDCSLERHRSLNGETTSDTAGDLGALV